MDYIKNKLLKIIMENPTLPIVFIVDSDSMYDDYSCTLLENYNFYVSTIYKTDDRYYDDYDEIHDEFRDKLCEEEKFKDIEDDNEYDKAVDEWIDKYIEHYEAIVIRVY